MIDTNTTYGVSFRCYFPDDGGTATRYNSHYQCLPLDELPTWIEAYRFTHPNCLSVTAKVWFSDCAAKRGGED